MPHGGWCPHYAHWRVADTRASAHIKHPHRSDDCEWQVLARIINDPLRFHRFGFQVEQALRIQRPGWQPGLELVSDAGRRAYRELESAFFPAAERSTGFARATMH